MQGYEISIVGPSETPDLCWREVQGRGHFEITNHPQPEGRHECFAISKKKLSRKPSCWPKKIKTSSPDNLENTSVARFFGSTPNSAPAPPLFSERQILLCNIAVCWAILSTVPTILLVLWMLSSEYGSRMLEWDGKTWAIMGLVDATIKLLVTAGLLAWGQLRKNYLQCHPLCIPGVICVEGNIGSGKSTLLYGLQNAGLMVYQEPVGTRWKEHLSTFYENKARWGFTFQIEVLQWFIHLQSLLWIKGIGHPGKYQTSLKLVERSPMAAYHIFAKNMWRMGNLTM